MWQVKVYWLNGELACCTEFPTREEAQASARAHSSNGMIVQMTWPDGSVHVWP